VHRPAPHARAVSVSQARWSDIPSCIARAGGIMNNQALCERSAQASAKGAASRHSRAIHQLGGPEEEPKPRLRGRPLSTRVVACPLAQRSPAGAALEPLATPVKLPATGHQRRGTQSAGNADSIRRLGPNQQLGSCNSAQARQQVSGVDSSAASASARCWARQEALRCRRKISDRSE
jgi:hypothetical protein